MGRLLGRVLTVTLLTLILNNTGMAAESITIAGDPCTVPLAEKLGDAFTKKTGIQVKVESAGCANGIYRASIGEVNIGVSTHEVDLKSLPLGTTNTIIAKAPTVILVNKTNPVNNLTLQQVKEILSGKVKNWKEVGGKDMEIKNILLQPCTTAIFAKRTVAYGSDIKRLTPEKKGNPVTATNRLVEENEGAMGLQIYGYESPNVKVLTIDGYLPDENAFPVKYGFYQDYNVITKGEPTGNVKAFIDFATGPEGQDIVASMKHIRVRR
jgi:phosphate transport system substrate-binding protein